MATNSRFVDTPSGVVYDRHTKERLSVTGLMDVANELEDANIELSRTRQRARVVFYCIRTASLVVAAVLGTVGGLDGWLAASISVWALILVPPEPSVDK